MALDATHSVRKEITETANVVHKKDGKCSKWTEYAKERPILHH